MFNLGEIKIELHVSIGGEIKINTVPLLDKLREMFPIDENKRLFISEDDFKEYEQSVLEERERWVKENIPAGVYSFVVDLASWQFKKEEV